MTRHATTPPTGPILGKFTRSLSVRFLLFALTALVIAGAVIPTVALAAPLLTTSSATKVHHTSAVLNGHLDPDSDPVIECSFEWGTTVAYGNVTPCNEGNAFASAADVSANLGNLTPGTIYHFRLHAETTSSGPFNGADTSFRPDTFPITHPEVASFGPDGTPASSFAGLFNLAFNQQTRELYAHDRGDGAIYGFNASGPSIYTPLAGFDPLGVIGKGESQDQPDIAVDGTALPSAGNVYFVSEVNLVLPPEPPEYKIYGYDSSGTPLPGFPIKTATGKGCGAAVDSAGHLWVANHENTVEEFSSAGVNLGSVSIPKPFAICKLAFDSNNDMYVVGQNGPVWKYTAASGYVAGTGIIPSTNNNNVAIDTSTNTIYASHYAEPSEGRFPNGMRVDEYDSAGHFLGEFAVGRESSHVTVDATSHNVFVASQNKIYVYDAGVSTTAKLPTATTGKASPITGSGATLNGFVDPEGMPVTDCYFAWGPSNGNFENKAPCSSSPGLGSGDVAVSAGITGLSSGATYSFRVLASNANGVNGGREGQFTTSLTPFVSDSAPTNVSNGSADLNGLVNPQGFATTYHFEWGLTSAYGNSAPVPDGNAGSGEVDVPVSAHIAGLASSTRYFWRLVGESVNGKAVTEGGSFFTLGAPLAETTGAPMRTIDSAQLGARVTPNGFATSYHFEYGAQGPCASNPCAATDPRPAGSGPTTELVAEEVSGLEANTTYHYRVVVDNGQPGSPVLGGDMTVTTRADEAPLSHGHFPGPPGSDRAYEQISPPDTGGNPVNGAMGFSPDGSRAFYAIAGGTPISETGNFSSLYFAQRTESAPHEGSWQAKSLLPPRGTATGSSKWKASPDITLTNAVAANSNETAREAEIWHLDSEGPPTRLFAGPLDAYGPVGVFGPSDDGSRLIGLLRQSQDPEHPVTGKDSHFYDLTSGTPRLADLLPDGSVPECGVAHDSELEQTQHAVSPDGARLFFTTAGEKCGASNVYVRDFDAEETKRLSPQPISGLECDSVFLSSTPSAAFIYSESRLAAEDSEPSNCAFGNNGLNGDIYRVELNNGNLKCITCIVAGVDADVYMTVAGAEWSTGGHIIVSEDGSRVYFESPHALVSGAPATGGGGSTYRVNVNTGDLAWVAGPNVNPVSGGASNAGVTPDGSTVFFRSSAQFLNPLNGSDNGGTVQYYRYDDRDRSLVCLSCPPDGGTPRADVLQAGSSGNGRSLISDDGEDIAFITATPLVGADQNTAGVNQDAVRGTDVYEWRDGRYFLVTDGLTNWTPGAETPGVSGIGPGGRDLYFTAPAQYTPDALDGYNRLYDARIGGGFLYPQTPPPCPLEVCQGAPKGAPEEQAPGTRSFSGPGNAKAQVHRSKRKKHKAKKHHHKAVKKHAKSRANHNRRASR